MPGVITGKHILYDASCIVNGTDLSDHVEQVTVEVTTNKQMASAMGDIYDYDMPGTLALSSIAATFYQDYNTSKVYAVLSAAFTARSTFSLYAKASSGANSATNPQFQMTVFVEKAPLMAGKRGDRHMAPVTFALAAALVIATS